VPGRGAHGRVRYHHFGVTGALRIVQLNLAYGPAIETPAALVNAYHTLTEWAEAVASAGADVVTVQRFRTDAEIVHGRCRIVFAQDEGEAVAPPWADCRRPLDAVVSLNPHLVHVNGLIFPGAVHALRRRLPAATAIAVQDHSGALPRPWPWPFEWLRRRQWRAALGRADLFVFTARMLAERWHAAGLPLDAAILELPEAGTTVAPLARAEAIAITSMRASPAILWVGRLDANKDPLTVLSALEMALPRLPAAHAWMIYRDAPLEATVAQRIAASGVLRERVHLVGAVPHDRIAAWFSASDIFVSGSHHEGSGYSLIEAMACGAIPCVTSIPPFRALTGGLGALWTAGDADACAAALVDLASRDRDAERVSIRRHYADALSWEQIGRRTVARYRALADARRDRLVR
jgi:glycosyltransferase involved in cell wall biosynthesis